MRPYNSSYYYIGHFSRYIKAGAVRIGIDGNTTDTQASAFRNKDGSFVTVIMNETEKTQKWTVQLGEESLAVSLLPHSIVSVKMMPKQEQ